MTEKFYRKLSPSRIGTLNKCSWSYWSNYHLKVPQENNDGARRGSIIHDLFECLIKNTERHKWKYDRMLKSGDAFSIPCIDRFIKLKARQYDLNLNRIVVTKNRASLITNRDYINEMILIGLDTPFYGKEGVKIIAEMEHSLDVDRPDEGIRYIVRGFLDKTFLYENESGDVEEVEITDYKSSKSKFDKHELKYNKQGIIYQLFALDLFPKIKKLNMKFLFLQFPRSRWQEVDPLPLNIIKGIEIYLTELFLLINNFTEEDAKKNFAKHKGLKSFCGKKGFKTYNDKQLGKITSPEENWICPYKEPQTYYAILSPSGDPIQTAKTKEELVLKEGQEIKEMNYEGCPAWYVPKSHLKRLWGLTS